MLINIISVFNDKTSGYKDEKLHILNAVGALLLYFFMLLYVL
jgi:hypothetical protein